MMNVLLCHTLSRLKRFLGEGKCKQHSNERTALTEAWRSRGHWEICGCSLRLSRCDGTKHKEPGRFQVKGALLLKPEKAGRCTTGGGLG